MIMTYGMVLVGVSALYAGKAVVNSSELVPLVQQGQEKTEAESKELQELRQCAGGAQRTIGLYDPIKQPLNNTGYVLQAKEFLLSACAIVKKIGVKQLPEALSKQLVGVIRTYNTYVPNARYVWQGTDKDEGWIKDRYPIIEFPGQ
jgi:hypothetical protein